MSSEVGVGDVLIRGLGIVTAGVRELSSVMRACAMSLPVRAWAFQTVAMNSRCLEACCCSTLERLTNSELCS